MTPTTPTPVFTPVEPKADFPALERRVRQRWERGRIFQRSVEERPAERSWIFYEGPPTANGLPGVHHVLARSFKDLYPRYKTMRGHRVVRKGGWDTHGLPVEVEVEKELGFKTKQDIEAYGIAAFNEKCKQSGNRYIQEWVEFTHRMGYWVDLEDPYITYETPYMESVWAVLKQMWERDLLYTAYKVVPYCPRCQTPLSSHELSQGYRDDTRDPSVFPMFELQDEPGTYFLAWTTTPWTLPGNVALAVAPEIPYVKVRTAHPNPPGGVPATVQLILAEARLAVLEGEYEVVDRMRSTELVGKTYRPLFEYLIPEEPAFFVVEADFVSVDDGTGVVHTAAAYGVEDLRLCQEKGIPVRHVVDLRGRFRAEVIKFAGMFVKDADVPIMKDLAERGLLYKKGTIRHTYPFCWRCETPLLYYALDSWFVRTSSLRERLVEVNHGINWVPDHIRDGRMGNWLEGGVDWSLSRYRYWATPLPVWVCERCGRRRCVGAVAELGLTLADDIHRPHIDEVTLPCADCAGSGVTVDEPDGSRRAPLMRRVQDLVDVWFDSGAMPYAQYHWMFESGGEAESPPQFPADFICEAIDQTRGWFYSLLAISTLVSGESSYRNVVCLSHVVDPEGKKMSKSRGNTVDPMEMMDRFGADALRWYFYTAVAVGNEYRVGPRVFADVVGGFMRMVWNCYLFFVQYANLDGFDPAAQPPLAVAERPLLDRWLLSELSQCVTRVTDELEVFDATGAGRAIESLVNDLSNWYVRRSRRRFWKSASDHDKLSAYQTLHQALCTISTLMAPFAPFIADELYTNLARGGAESVHLAEWPVADAAAVDRELSAAMVRARRVVELGHKERDRAGFKVRQPLARATVPGHPLPAELEAILLDELNLKALDYTGEDGHTVRLDTTLTPELRQEGLARELVRRLQELRKQAGFNVEDRIHVAWAAEGPAAEAMTAWREHIAAETLALSLAPGPAAEGSFEAEVSIEGSRVRLAVLRAPLAPGG
jgi:isoleucyl-tRNA synthetase